MIKLLLGGKKKLYPGIIFKWCKNIIMYLELMLKTLNKHYLILILNISV
jgi:hypothetical protein